MELRKATFSDIDDIAALYEAAKDFMHSNGNPNQWNDGHPNKDDAILDVENGFSYVCCENGEVVGCCYFRLGIDETYLKIYEGDWIDDGEYAVVHRIAVKYRGRGIIGFMLEELSLLSKNLRIDTHRDNLPMQRALSKNGFKYCGIIYLHNGDERLAYQRLRK